MELIQKLRKNFSILDYPTKGKEIWKTYDGKTRFANEFFERLESIGAKSIKVKTNERKDKYGDITQETSFRVYHLNNNMFFISAKTEYVSPDIPESSAIEESIMLRNYKIKELMNLPKIGLN